MKDIITGDLLAKKLQELNDKIALLKTGEILPNIQKEADINLLLELASTFLRTMDTAWFESNYSDKLVIQKLIYPEGVMYQFPSFRTEGISLIFQFMSALSLEENAVWTRQDSNL